MPPFRDAELPVVLVNLPSVAGCRRRWLQDEILSLASCYPAGEPVADISKRFGRSSTAIYGKARRLGLSRPQRRTSVLVAEDIPPGQIKVALSVPTLGLVAPTPANPPFLPPLEALVAEGVPPAQVEAALPVPILDLVAPTPANPPFLPPVELPAPLRKPAKPFHLTPLGGRQTVWSPELVRRLILLWVAGFHHTVIAEVLDLTPCGVSSKAVRISLPYRGSLKLSKDVAEARRVDAAGGALPSFIVDGAGRHLIGKACNLSGIFFYGTRGTHTSVEAKLTLHYDRMRQSAF